MSLPTTSSVLPAPGFIHHAAPGDSRAQARTSLARRLSRRAWTALLLALPLAPAYAAPANDLAPLSFFLGSWQCAGQFAHGKPIRSGETFTAELDGHWLRMRHADAPPNRYAADEWWGYDHATKRFTVTIFDNFGGERRYVSPGWNGAVLTLENTATSGYIDRFVFHRDDDAHYRFSYARKDDSGGWKLIDELVCSKDSASG